jgi:hypothetical protein
MAVQARDGDHVGLETGRRSSSNFLRLVGGLTPVPARPGCSGKPKTASFTPFEAGFHPYAFHTRSIYTKPGSEYASYRCETA